MNQATPYETRLHFAATEAHAAGDAVDGNLIAHMIEQILNGEYEEVRGLFPSLRPIYRSRLGPPPVSRDADGATRPGR